MTPSVKPASGTRRSNFHLLVAPPELVALELVGERQHREATSPLPLRGVEPIRVERNQIVERAVPWYAAQAADSATQRRVQVKRDGAGGKRQGLRRSRRRAPRRFRRHGSRP